MSTETKNTTNESTDESTNESTSQESPVEQTTSQEGTSQESPAVQKGSTRQKSTRQKGSSEKVEVPKGFVSVEDFIRYTRIEDRALIKSYVVSGRIKHMKGSDGKLLLNIVELLHSNIQGDILPEHFEELVALGWKPPFGLDENDTPALPVAPATDSLDEL